MVQQPPSASTSPRFCNTGNFMRMPRLHSLEGMDFAIFGIPFDTGSSYRTGSRFGPSAIRSISTMIKPNNVILEVNILDELKGGDYGDVNIIPGYIEPSFEAIEKFMESVVAAGVTPIALGGDHSITLAELRAVAAKYGKLSLVHFDSHLDLNMSVFGQKHNHGTPFRRALEEGLIDPSHSIQVGMRGSLYDPNDFKIAADLGFKVIPAHIMREMGLNEVSKAIVERVGNTPVFYTFDIDFVDPAYAPGTGTPEVGGFTSWEALSLMRSLKNVNFVGFDIVEVLPTIDQAELTAYLAYNIVFEFLSIMAWKKKSGR